MRRHGGKLATPPNEPEVKQDNDLKKVADMIESFSNKLLEKEQKEREEKEQQERRKRIEENMMQEKLRFEQELHKLKSAVYQELDEEKRALREERRAFEELVSTQTKQIPHVGNMEDDDEKSKDEEKQEKLILALKDQLEQQLKQTTQALHDEHVPLTDLDGSTKRIGIKIGPCWF